MASTTRQTMRSVALAVAASAAFGLAGCSDGVELNGKLFDALGVSAASQAAAKREPQLPQRSGLVMPPDQTRLPEPGAQGGEVDPQLAALNDPEKKKELAAAERARLHKAYCSGELTWKESAFNREHQARSPYGPCGGLAVGNMFNKQ